MFKDLQESLSRIGIAIELAKTDIRKSYTRTALGPFWETISLGILLYLMSVLWGKLIEIKENYVMYLVTGMIVFRYISLILNSSTWTFIERADIVKYFNIPHSSLALSKVIYASFIFLHHLPLLFIFSFFYQNTIFNFNLIYLLYSVPVILLTSYSTALLVGFLTARFRDIQSLINTITSVMIFFTPILWSPSRLDVKAQLFLVDPNIFYHYIELFRQPFLGNKPELFSIVITLLFTTFIFFFANWILNKFSNKIRYWV